MKIMVNYPNKSNEAAGWLETAFIEEFARLCAREGHECKLVGEGMPDHVQGWTFKEYHRNYFKNELDWMLGYFHLFPDWLTNPSPKERPEGFTGQIAEWTYDMHVDPDGLIAEANAKIDLWLMRSTQASVYFPTRAQWNGCRGATPDEWIANGFCVRKESDYFEKQITTNYMLFPLSMSPTFFRPIDAKDYDLAMVGIISPYYPLRTAIYNGIQKFAKDNAYRLLLHPSPPNEYTANIQALLASPTLRKQFSVGPDYAERIAKSNMFVFCSGFAQCPIGKYFEGMMAGTAVVADMPLNAMELHFKPDKNFIAVDASNWRERIKYYLDHPQDRALLAQNARETAERYHTDEVRAKQLLERLKTTERSE